MCALNTKVWQIHHRKRFSFDPERWWLTSTG